MKAKSSRWKFNSKKLTYKNGKEICKYKRCFGIGCPFAEYYSTPSEEGIMCNYQME
jgi:hypothetical protein